MTKISLKLAQSVGSVEEAGHEFRLLLWAELSGSLAVNPELSNRALVKPERGGLDVVALDMDEN